MEPSVYHELAMGATERAGRGGGWALTFAKSGLDVADRVVERREASRLWWVACLAGLAAVLFGAIGAYAQAFAPWIGSLTTIAAAVAAYGLVDRRKYLIASYAGMQVSLKRIKALDEAQPASLADLVTETEDLLDREHGELQPRILGTLHKPPPEAEAPGAVG
jgi:SMODS and SLOG-associating 2TM effector domain 1